MHCLIPRHWRATGSLPAFFVILAVLATAVPSLAGPQHWGFGMSYLAAVKQIGGQKQLVVYEGPLRAKNATWISRWIDRTTDVSAVISGGIAVGNFWPSDPGKEYLVLVSQSGTTVTLRVLDAPECFKVGQWTLKSTGTVTVSSGSVVAAATGDLASLGKDQLLLLVQDGATLKVLILTPPTTSTGTTWTISRQGTLPSVTGSYLGFACGDFWNEDKDRIALATSVGGATRLAFYSFSTSTNTFSLITTDAAGDLPVLAQNGLTAGDYVKDGFDVLTLLPSEPASLFQLRVAPAKSPSDPYNPGPWYTGKAISRQLLPGNGGGASQIVMTGTFGDSGALPTALGVGRVFGYLINIPTTPQAVSPARDAEIVFTHRTPLKGERSANYGWPYKDETVTWDINLKNNGPMTIPKGAVTLKVWINTPYRNADTNPATCGNPDYTIPVGVDIPAFNPIIPSYTVYPVTCAWPYDLVPTEPGSSYMRLNLYELGERWLVISMDCTGDTIVRNNRYEAMLGAQTFHPSFTTDPGMNSLADHRGPGIPGDPSSYEYIYRKLADAEVCMFERSGTTANEDVLQRPYFDGYEMGIPDLGQGQGWEYVTTNYEGWRSQNHSRADLNQGWVRFTWDDGGAELHEVGHLYTPLGDLYQYYA